MTWSKWFLGLSFACAAQAESAIRVLYIDGSWGVPPAQSVSRRLQDHLERITGRTVEVLSGERIHDTVSEIAELTAPLIAQFKPQFVYFRPRPSELVNEASVQAAPAFLGNASDLLSRGLRLQMGALILGRRLSSKFYAPTAITDPPLKAIGRLKTVSDQNGAQFRLLTGGLSVGRAAWTIPARPGLEWLRLFEVFKYRMTLTHARWLDAFHAAGIEVIDSSSIRFKLHSSDAADEAALVLASAISNADFGAGGVEAR